MLTGEAKTMMEDSVAWLDRWYDPEVGQLFEVNSNAAMDHETLSSAWYAVGLLARNGNDGQDVANAEHIIASIIRDQYKNEKDLWFGVYTRMPEEPLVGSDVYPARRYSSWDPNWYGFVGLSLITMYEDFGDLLSDATKASMLDSLRNASIGDSRRGGGVNGDNLYPAYSNPAIMRAIGTSWTGRKLGDAKITQDGEEYAQAVIDLFDMHGTLSEFNSATYTGISLWGLALWCRYGAEDSVIGKRGPDLLRGTFNTTAHLWHAGMRNLAGPWDRSYSLNMKTSLGILALVLTPLIGREASSLRRYPETMSHARDWAWASLVAVSSDTYVGLVSDEVKHMFETFDGERTWTGKAFYPPYDLEPRNITTWLGETIMIGAESYRTASKNGPSNNNGQFHPAVAQWSYGKDDLGWFTLRSTEAHVTFNVSARRLEITYPKGTAASVFDFFVSTSLRKRNVASWADIQGASISVSGNINTTPTLGYAGRYGGAGGKPYYDYDYWHFTHAMPANFTGVPRMVLEFADGPSEEELGARM
ncbi:hypothetical protein AURDEDRAFT_71425 [Auricularia subglabra TFB-10046 SS5]|nr:hypothetical protein AURDEDRAFT_71425 [Auricularia subglabra TFB-10046 SS5]